MITNENQSIAEIHNC